MNKFILIILFNLAFTSIYAEGDSSAVSAVRGVWLTNVDSKVLNSERNIKEAVDLCEESGINTIFVVVWNKGMTTYPSKIMKDFTGIGIDTALTGGRDPLKELIETAHQKNIKVIAWFEFGFSSSYKENGGKILKLKPEWSSKNIKDSLVQKNGFEWMNGFNPEVQNFMLSLIMEVARNYKIDGIQGDDRLPAMPSEAGYDNFTVNLYKTQHEGKTPPKNPKDSAWVQWRADLLTNFMGEIHDSVKAVNKDLIVSMAPSIYPWSKEEYLQDWPEWLNKGYIDLICPQLYRYEVKDYKTALEEIVNTQISKKNLYKFYPGILLKVGNYYAPKDYLKEVIKINRENSVNGEIYFFFEGIKKYPDLFKNELYKEKAAFPDLAH